MCWDLFTSRIFNLYLLKLCENLLQKRDLGGIGGQEEDLNYLNVNSLYLYARLS